MLGRGDPESIDSAGTGFLLGAGGLSQRLQGFAPGIQHKRRHTQISRFPAGLQLEAVARTRIKRANQLAHHIVVIQRAAGVFSRRHFCTVNGVRHNAVHLA